MFHRTPPKPTEQKHVVYLISSTILGLLLSFMVHAAIEINYLSWAAQNKVSVTFYGNCALPPALQIIIWILGAIGGYYLGEFWWRKIYVERVWVNRFSKR